ncbi:MAG TPA: hypothetical protein VFV07_05750 [Rhizomicrobium sp.]|nr:hypothetical protein [Rhizomicrobium sp.]
MLRNYFLGAAALAALAGAQADAAVTISNKPTHDFQCTSGVCTATARKANMNAGDLASMLASSDIALENGQLTKGFDFDAALSWASTHKLTIETRAAINFLKPINVTGGGALAIRINQGQAELNFYPGSRIIFLDTSSQFSIDDTSFTLVADIQTLANDIAAQPSGAFALANSYDAGPDGVYTDDPIPTVFSGDFHGLGNTISGLRIKSSTPGNLVGLFHGTEEAVISDLRLEHVKVEGGKQSTTGGLAGLCSGLFVNVSVSGNVSAGLNSYVGGVCGAIDGNIVNVHSAGIVTGKGDNGTSQNAVGGVAGSMQGNIIGESSSSAKVTGGKGWAAGGLIGQSIDDNLVTQSYATGTVSVGDNGIAGGLVGNNADGSHVDTSYATGFVGGGVSSTVGGFIGLNNGPVTDAYSSGAVASGSGNAVGGLIGNDLGANDLTDTYWDTDTSGQSHGVGSNTAYPGVTGLTTAQFQAGLPAGFNSLFWAEDPSINNGLPYLLPENPQ